MATGSNAFGDVNPFADPAIANVTNNAQNMQASLDNYNPFANKQAAIISTSNVTPEIRADSSQPAPSGGAQNFSSNYKSTSASLNLNEIERQQEELERRAAEVERREKMLTSTDKGMNFPPLPSWCPSPLKPCFYQDIAIEIPVEFQRWVRLLFYLWLFYTFTLAFNIISALVALICTGKYGITFGFSIFYFILFVPLSYVCWFRPAYKGFRSDSSINFMIFFFVFFCQIVICFLMVLGFTDSGYCGIITLVAIFSTAGVSNLVAGFFVLFTSICFIANAAANVLILIKIHALYRGTSATLEKAQFEFASGVMSNKNVQKAATTAATSVINERVRESMNPSAGGGKL